MGLVDIPTTGSREFQLLLIRQPLSVTGLCNLNGSVGHVVVSPCGFHLYFPRAVEPLFRMFIGHLDIISYDVFVHIFCLFFAWAVFLL